MSTRTWIAALTTFGAIAAAQGCATATVVEDPDASDLPAPTDAGLPEATTQRPDTGKVDSAPPTPDSSLPDSGPADTSTAPADAAADADASVLAPRAGEPFDPAAPKAGDPCPVGVNLNDTISRRCGKCGSQSALCEAGAGGAKVVGAYGACTGEKTTPAACLPRERLLADCGICGKQTKDCDLSCSYVEGACQGQLPGGCPANEETFLEGLCTNPGDVRRQVCSATCVKGTPEPCAPRPAPAPDHTIDLGAANVPVLQPITFDPAKTLPIPESPFLSDPAACPLTLSGDLRSYRYVRVQNTGATARTVTISTTDAGDTLLAYYAGPAPVPTAAARRACTGQYSDDAVGLHGSISGVVIPAGDAITAYVANYSSGGGTTTFKVVGP